MGWPRPLPRLAASSSPTGSCSGQVSPAPLHPSLWPSFRYGGNATCLMKVWGPPRCSSPQLLAHGSHSWDLRTCPPLGMEALCPSLLCPPFTPDQPRWQAQKELTLRPALLPAASPLPSPPPPAPFPELRLTVSAGQAKRQRPVWVSVFLVLAASCSLPPVGPVPGTHCQPPLSSLLLAQKQLVQGGPAQIQAHSPSLSPQAASYWQKSRAGLGPFF